MRYADIVNNLIMNDAGEEIPNSFAETVQLVENYALAHIERETTEKKLYYHTVNHAFAVKRRANQIFQAIEPVLQNYPQSLSLDRAKNLIDLCATAHDMVQEILPATEANVARKRPVRVSEFATIDKLIKYIENLNQKLSTLNTHHSAKFNALDIQIIKEAITATICELDSFAADSNSDLSSNSIYQPYLYKSPEKISLVANVVALADLGTLGMEGIEPYLHEGVLVFLEENPDLVKSISMKTVLNQQANQDDDITKKRLLNMTRFMVGLAQDRLIRFERELTAFPAEAQQILQHQLFKYLNTNTINKIKELTPTDDKNSLTELLDFFHLYRHL